MLLKNTILGKLLFSILLFLFVYPLKLIFLPVSFRVLFAAFGIGLLAVRLVALKKTYFSYRLVNLYLVIASVCLMSLLAIVVNHTADLEYVNFWILPTVCLLSAYFLIMTGMYIVPGFDFKKLSYYYVGVVLFQCVISAVMFVKPDIYLALLKIQQMDALDMTKSEQLVGGRLLGLGASFMILGVVNCIALMLIAILMKYDRTSFFKRLYLIICFLIISSIGMMQARTTVVGTGLAVCYLCFSSWRIGLVAVKKSIRVFAGIILFCLVSLIVLELVAGDFIQKNQYIIDYGFELFINYQKSGKLESASTNDLANMYNVMPDTKALIIGDGKFYNVPGVPFFGYYKGVDAGFLRLIYYFGIPGMLLFLLYQYLLIKYSFMVPVPGYKVLILYFFLLLLLWNIKNVMDVNILYTPFMILNILLSRSRLKSLQPPAVEFAV